MKLEQLEKPNIEKGNPYGEFSIGGTLDFTLYTLEQNGRLETTPRQIEISDIRGGGFFGKVLIPKDQEFVIKTSKPDPWHEFWRLANWKLQPFPAQVDETSAQLEHLSGQLIHRVLPTLTFSEFYSPNSLGYTKLPTGYAQVVEKMSGRGPRFDLPTNEIAAFREAQIKLSKAGYKLGLEQTAQIDPDNPYAMANIWYDEKSKRWIWLDTIPAIPHNGWTLPMFRFNFHYKIRDEFARNTPTFNRIHTDRFSTEVLKNRHLFSDEEYRGIMDQLMLYEDLWEQRIRNHLGKPKQRDFAGAKTAFCESAKNFTKGKIAFKLLSYPDFRQETADTIIKLVKDPAFRIEFLNKNYIMKGVEQARKAGIISEEELEGAWDELKTRQSDSVESKKRLLTLAGLQAYYIASGLLINMIEGSVYLKAALSDNKLSTVVLGILIGRGLPALVRPLGTKGISLATGENLDTATIFSIVPVAGSVLALPMQAISDAESRNSGIINHYSIRAINQKLSKLSPSGGWGTSTEAKLWELFGRRLEGLSKKLAK